MKYLLVGGGTAGHINPALAIARKIKDNEKDAEIFFAGTPKGMESRLIPPMGYPFYPIKVSGIHRGFSFDDIKLNAVALKNLVFAVHRARKILKEVSPDVVIGTGGYVSGPIVKTAQKMGIKTAIHEQNAFPGVTTKLLSKKADVIMLASEASEKYIERKDKCVIVGNPVRKEILEADRESSRKRLGLDERPLILSFGGSLGAKIINETIADVLEWHIPEGKYQHIHGVGKSGMDWFPDLLKEKGVDTNKKGIRISEYINDMNDCMAAADIVICRAGAITLSELQTLGKPSVLIPSPYVAENHQYHNAMALVNAGAAVIAEEKDVTGEKLIEILKTLLDNPEKLKEMGKNAKKSAIENASDRIYVAIKSIM